MKNNYIAVQIKENEKYYAYAVKVTESDNLLSKLEIKDIIHANLCDNKKRAKEIVNFWNDCAKTNGNYMFDEMF